MKSGSYTSMLPNGDMEIVFSFDTTGSMSSSITTVRQVLQDIMERLFADIPGLKVAMFAHGDYCDARTSYVTKFVNFTNDVQKLCKFAQSTGPTGGGDADECYELVLHQVRNELNWTPGTQRALVLIGDANPHEPSYHMNELKLDWRKETQELKEMGVRIYGVQCRDDYTVEPFYQHISDETGGVKIKLDDLSSIVQMLMAVCYREKGPEFFQAFEQEVRRENKKITRTLSGVFDALRDGDVTIDRAARADTPPVTEIDTTPLPRFKRKIDFDAVDAVTPSPKRHCSPPSNSGSSRRTPKMTTRSMKHRMALRKRPSIRLPKRI